MNKQILNRYTGKVIFEAAVDTLKELSIAALLAGAATYRNKVQQKWLSYLINCLYVNCVVHTSFVVTVVIIAVMVAAVDKSRVPTVTV